LLVRHLPPPAFFPDGIQSGEFKRRFVARTRLIEHV